MKKSEELMKIQHLPIDEKLARLSETDKAYILGYVDRALLDRKQHGNVPKKQTGREAGEH